MQKKIRIGTRDSQLAIWQATLAERLLKEQGFDCELVFIKTEGDADLVTPLYEIGVQGIFTRALDTALLNNRIDVAVHSMKDVPVQPAKGIIQAAVLPRASYHDLLVYRQDKMFLSDFHSVAVIATSSIRRRAQWLHRYPDHYIENLRGNVNTRLRKVQDSQWHGAIFAAAGLERIGLRPAHSVTLNWMLPAPAQGAIMLAARESDTTIQQSCASLNDYNTELCTRIERDFLKGLLGGCSMPVSALAVLENDTVHFKANIFSTDGKRKAELEKQVPVEQAGGLGFAAAAEILAAGGGAILEPIRNDVE